MGSEAGNLALKVLATSGVYITGGIPLHILPAMRGSRFLESFRKKGRFSEMMERIPVHIIVSHVGLAGAAAYGLSRASVIPTRLNPARLSMVVNQSLPVIVVVGGGFGGLAAAKALCPNAGPEVILIDRNNHHLFQPLLYQVATSTLSPAYIASPLRGILGKHKNIAVVMGEVSGVNPSDSTSWSATPTARMYRSTTII